MRKNEVWQPFIPNTKLEGTLYSLELVNSDDRLIFSIRLEPSYDCYEVVFEEWITFLVSYQDRSVKITEHNNNGGIYFVENSFLKKIESFDWEGQHNDCYHFVFPSFSLNAEILSGNKPDFRFICHGTAEEKSMLMHQVRT